ADGRELDPRRPLRRLGLLLRRRAPRPRRAPGHAGRGERRLQEITPSARVLAHVVPFLVGGQGRREESAVSTAGGTHRGGCGRAPTREARGPDRRGRRAPRARARRGRRGAGPGGGWPRTWPRPPPGSRTPSPS